MSALTIANELGSFLTHAAFGAGGAHPELAIGSDLAVGQAPSWVALIPALPALGAVLCVVYAIMGNKTKLPAFTTVALLAVSFVLTVAAYGQFTSGTDGAAVTAAWHWFDLSWGDGPGQTFKADFGFYIDGLSLLWMLFVTGLATLIALYASEYMDHDVGPGYCRFFGAFGLFVFSMACLVLGDNLLMLYLGWEGVGLCSYLLIGYFYKKDAAVQAAKKAFIVNRIGDLGLALGVFLTFVHFGTIEYAQLFTSEQLAGYIAAVQSGDLSAVPLQAQLIPVLLMIGAFGKSAQFPLYVWLPDAMEGPTPVSALIHAATMVTAGVYLIARFYPIFLVSQWALPIVAWAGAITALLAATIGMAQFDIKRIMAYSTVSQLGYMFCGLAVLTPTGGVFHVLTHAFFKALLFLCCGAVMHGFAGQLDLRKLSGLWKMPGWRIVSIGMLVGCLNLAGFPFTGGFFSKDTILAEAFITAGPGYQWIGIILLITAGLTAYYTFRVFFRVFVGPKQYEAGDELHDHTDDAHGEEHAHDPGEHGDHHADGFHPHAPGWAINTVLASLAVLSVASSGLYFIGADKDKGTKHWVDTTIARSTAVAVYPKGADEHADDAHGSASPVEPGVTLVAMRAEDEPKDGSKDAKSHASDRTAAFLVASGAHASHDFYGLGDPHKVMYYVSGVIGFVGISLAFLLHLAGRKEAGRCNMDGIAKMFGPVPRWAENKWYVDEFYNIIFRIPLLVFSHLFHAIDRVIVDGLVNLFGYLPRQLGKWARPGQSGILHGYALGMAGGFAVLLLVVLAVVA